jgi:hypothetical protein
MNWNKWLEKWGMSSLKIKAPFLEMAWEPTEPDKNAAWQLYIELLTRITTQSLLENSGDEKTALASVHSLFPTTRGIIKDNGRECIEFTKLAVVILNQKVRPFTSKWHNICVNKEFKDASVNREFREELGVLQSHLTIYTKMLADMAGVEDLTELEQA